ncbi:hypothetical protein [Streptomyces sp. 303MFCol5.2]|uniref:hypothetical protein n=1 Tax=Streptomyces sp. 303MFCol5.2 TaxID=1172181 RepID=UPI000371A8D6|nr:hypothetical protein [Streptomyces sp. 303MFCol5.2]
MAKIVAEYAARHSPATEASWIAEVDGERAGCVFLVADEDPHHGFGHDLVSQNWTLDLHDGLAEE